MIAMPKQKFVFVLGTPHIEAQPSRYLAWWCSVDGRYGCVVAKYLCGARAAKEIALSIAAAPDYVWTAILPLEV